MSSGVVAGRAANALIADAEAVLPQVIPRVQQVRATLDRFGFAHRGLWVGGRATLTAESVCFHPNAVNRRLMHACSLDIEIPLPDLVSIEVLPAFVSSVIVLRSNVKAQVGSRFRTLGLRSFRGRTGRRAIDGSSQRTTS